MESILEVREFVLLLRTEDPWMKAADIAREVGRTRERVRQILISLDLPTKFIRTLDICEYCKGNIPARHYRSKYCSRKCFMDSRVDMFTCDSCGKLFKRRIALVRYKREVKGSIIKFCDRRCWGRYMGTRWGWQPKGGSKFE